MDQVTHAEQIWPHLERELIQPPDMGAEVVRALPVARFYHLCLEQQREWGSCHSLNVKWPPEFTF